MCSCVGSLLLLLLLLLAVLAGQAHSNCNSYRKECIKTTLTVGRVGYRAEGPVVAYSNTSFSQVSGTLYVANRDFGCSNGTDVLPSLTKPFVLFIPLTANCGDYVRAVAAQQLGAVGVIFYSLNNKMTSTGGKSLKVAVTLISIRQSHDSLTIQLTQDSSEPVRLVQVDGATVYAKLQHNTVRHRSQTFYFVVFAFSLLVVLSLTWFIVTYTKRLFERCSSRRRRVSSDCHSQISNCI